MHFPGRAAAAVWVVCAAYAAGPAQAQVTQAPPQSGSPPAAGSTPPGPPSAPVVPLFIGSSALIPGWSFNLAPYGWVAGVNAKINTPTPGGGVATTDVSVPFSDLLHDLRFGVLLAGEARYDRFSVITDVMYLNLGMNLSAAHLSSVSLGPSGRIDIPVQLEASAGTGLGTTVWTLAGGYTLAAGGWGNVDAIAGTRLLAVDVTTNYDLNAAILLPNRTIALAKSGSLGVNVDDWDAIVGTTGRINIANSGFYVPYYLDVGTGELPLTWQAFTGLGYHTSWADYSIGYRYLAFEGGGSAAVKNLAMSGVMAVASFHF
jgi:hypothetical protein